MKLALSFIIFVVLGAVLIAIAVQTAALALGLVVFTGYRDGPLAPGNARVGLGKCAGLAAGSSVVGLLPLGILLAPAACGVGLRVLFGLTWRVTGLVLLASTGLTVAARALLGVL